MQALLYLLIFLVSVLVGWFTWRSDKLKAVPKPWVTATLRGMLAGAVLLLILSPFIQHQKKSVRKPYLIFLQDNSSSTGKNLGNDSAAFRLKTAAFLEAMKEDFHVMNLGFADGIIQDSLYSYHGQATNIGDALSDLRSFANTTLPGAIILATDGQFNTGENPIFQQLPLRSTLYGLVVGDTFQPKDIRLGRVYANEIVSANTQFQVTVDVLALGLAGHKGELQVLENTSLITTDALNVNSNRFDQSVSFTLSSGKPGWRQLTIKATAAQGEENLSNNEIRFYIQVVAEQKKVLIAAFAPHPDISAIQRALMDAERYQVTTKFSAEIPALDGYDAVILHQLPAQQGVIKSLSIPVWFILGNGSNLSEVSRYTKAFQARNQSFTDATPEGNKSFALFSLSAGAADFVGTLPPLWVPGSYVTPPNVEALIRDKNGLPLWFISSDEPATAITMGEGIWRWRMYEYKNTAQHKIVDELVQQTVSHLVSRQQGNSLRVSLNKNVWSERESIQFSGYFQSNNEAINASDVQLKITDSAGRVKQFNFEKLGNGYTLNSGLWESGFYTYTASTIYQGKTYIAKGQFVVDAQPLEDLTRGADYELIVQLAKNYKGSALPWQQVNNLKDSLLNNPELKPVIEVKQETIPLINWRWMFLIILLVAAAEWYLRKYWMAQ